MKCAKARSLFSTHLDGLLAISDARHLDQHLGQCARCLGEFNGLQEAKSLLGSVGRKPVPDDLSLRLRLAISREMAQKREGSLAKLRFRLQTATKAFMVPATAGLLSAVVIFGLLIGFFALPSLHSDVPLMLYTPPELTMSPFGLSSSISSDSIVVEAIVDPNGRVQDYRVLSAPENKETTEVNAEIKNMLIFTIFRPATSFGRPTTGRAVLSFSRINVKG